MMDFDSYALSQEEQIALYQALVFPRLFEERMLTLLKQGKLGKWFSGIGQEAVAVGATLAMQDDEYILPMHRNLGVFTGRNINLVQLLDQFQGKYSGFTKGRDRSFHFGSQQLKIVGMISHLGPQLAVADGIALGHKLDREAKCVLVFTGEGGTSEGDFHEALNVAAVWDLPVIFLIENNGYALSTPTHEQYRCKNLVDKGVGYGIEAIKIDGNNILEVYSTISEKAREIRNHARPIIIECKTFRMRGHEEASGTKYIAEEEFKQWAEKDPVTNFENYLLQRKIITQEDVDQTRERFKQEIETAIHQSFSHSVEPIDPSMELQDMYAPFQPSATTPPSDKMSDLRYIDAISDALRSAMRRYDKLVMMGQDIARYGGAFKVSEHFVDEFGQERIRNTPLCESAIIGSALGLSIKEYKSIIEMQFADFVSMGFNQIVNNLAKSHYRWGQNADVVIRMPTGAGTGAGPFHSQSTEAWFMKTPGLKVVYPAFPYDAKGLLLSAIEDPNPVIYFEHKYLYRKIHQQIPDDYYIISIGKASCLQEGQDVCIITYGLGVHWALDYLDDHQEISATLIDLRSILPWDKQLVEEAVKKTGRVLILHEDTLVAGIGAEIAAYISENCFEYLDAPIMRCASLDTAVPMNKTLEEHFLAKSKLAEVMKKLLAY
ncbi:alpha-ketoacid dehydrogenase subunit alpha/beta [Albibacterium indicum]|uniref:alpha-ketoacid dehydrogenase subunit alpha/beta n=1 Tax=Albibacterium indicum TaxID=2292082 RepID=UPI001FE42045|nr:alpha-ketoacid dehydrogenase subunit alpha/beta [Pedobacter indicus]